MGATPHARCGSEIILGNKIAFIPLNIIFALVVSA